MTEPALPRDADLEKQNRILERRLKRLDFDVRQLEAFRDANSNLLTRLVDDLEAERTRSRELLLNVLPERIVKRLEAGESHIADRHETVGVLFADLVDFTRTAAGLQPHVVIDELNDLFSGFDAICEETGVEKIKTIGDAYLAVGGLAGTGDPTASVAEAALRMCAWIAARKNGAVAWRIRVGIHTGSLAAGVVGASRFAYDVWGDTVNMASRLEATSEPGRIQVSAEVVQRLGSRYAFERRGPVELKGKGRVETYFLGGRRDG